MNNMDDSAIFGIHAKALMLLEKRTEILANNLVNGSTPNFKARDFNFKQVLANQLQQKESSANMITTNSHHINANQGNNDLLSKNQLQYRVPYQPSLDGNTVDTEVEQTKFTQNSIRYQAELSYIKSRTHNLLLAIRGE